MPRMWWTPDGGSQERRTLLRDGSVLDPRTPRWYGYGGMISGNRGIITFVMQPQKNRSMSRVSTRSETVPQAGQTATLGTPAVQASSVADRAWTILYPVIPQSVLRAPP
jgi:hypothetical protein